MKYSELIYMIMDELKLQSDDAEFTEDHVIFLIDKYRTFLLKQRYSDIKREVPPSNYQSICLDVEPSRDINDLCGDSIYLKSTVKVPNTMLIGNTVISPLDYYTGNIAYISKERMRYVGHNKYLKNIIYCSLGPDFYMYLKSNNPQFLHLKRIKVTGVFEDTYEASKLECSENGSSCLGLEREFHLESALVPPLIELVVKELTRAKQQPADNVNNAADNTTIPLQQPTK